MLAGYELCRGLAIDIHKPDVTALEQLTLRVAGLATRVRHLIAYSGTVQRITKGVIGSLPSASGFTDRGAHLKPATIRCRIDFLSLSKFHIIKQTD